MPQTLFSKGKLDLLYLISLINLENLVINQIKKEGVEFLKIWSYHKRGSCRQVELRRFFPITEFGRLLGQLQAEGTKEFRPKLEFVNKSIQEHIDFFYYLELMGIKRKQISIGLIAHPNILRSIDLKEFESRTGLKIGNISQSVKSKGGYGYRAYIGSSIIAKIILGSMDFVREILSNSEWDDNLKSLAEGFLAKLLNGDGTLEIITKNR